MISISAGFCGWASGVKCWASCEISRWSSGVSSRGLRERKLWMMELDALRALPSGVRGPVDRWAFRRFSANFAAEIIYTHFSFRLEVTPGGFAVYGGVLVCC